MYNVKLEVFEGPFDLLFHLIEKNQIDIADIPIAQVTEEYLLYIRTMQVLDLHLAGDFLVLAATLVELKARMLLPRPWDDADDENEASDPRAEIVARLVEYRRFRNVSGNLRALETNERKYFRRVIDETVEYSRQLVSEETMPIAVLWEAFISVLNRRSDDENEQDISAIMPEEVSIEDKMGYILNKLSNVEMVDFRQLFQGRRTKLETIVTFLALLELVRLSKVSVTQDTLFGRISVSGVRLKSDSNEH